MSDSEAETESEDTHYLTCAACRVIDRADGVEENFEAKFHGCFHEVRPNELIVQTFTFEDMPGGVALEKLRLEPIGSGHTLLTATSLVDSFADRDAFIASDMESGVVDGYNALDLLLAR